MTNEDEILRCAQDDMLWPMRMRPFVPWAQRSFAALRMTELEPMFINGQNCGIDGLFSA